MAAMNRLYSIHSESELALQLKSYEQGCDFARSFKAKHKRENCESGIGMSPGV